MFMTFQPSIAGFTRLIWLATLCVVLHGTGAIAQVEGTPKPSNGVAPTSTIVTPRGLYWERAKKAISQNWTLFVDQAYPANGVSVDESVKVEFTIDVTGKTHEIKLTPKTASKTFVDLSVKAVTETPLPAPPPEMLDQRTGRSKPFSITFTHHGKSEQTK